MYLKTPPNPKPSNSTVFFFKNMFQQIILQSSVSLHRPSVWIFIAHWNKYPPLLSVSVSNYQGKFPISLEVWGHATVRWRLARPGHLWVCGRRNRTLQYLLTTCLSVEDCYMEKDNCTYRIMFFIARFDEYNLLILLSYW